MAASGQSRQSIPGTGRALFRPPFRLAILHSAVIAIAMILHSQRICVSQPPFDCLYVPYMITSGPLVYSVAHLVQHSVESHFPDSGSISWILVPGLICITLGSLQWTVIEAICLKLGLFQPPKYRLGPSE